LDKYLSEDKVSQLGATFYTVSVLNLNLFDYFPKTFEKFEIFQMQILDFIGIQ